MVHLFLKTFCDYFIHPIIVLKNWVLELKYVSKNKMTKKFLFGWNKMNIKKTILTILLWYSLKTAYQNPILHDFAKIAIV